MSEQIYYHRYSLKCKRGLEARSKRSELEGCLIKIGEGVGCIQPWVDMGDPNLDEQLRAIKEGLPFALGQQALSCARLDGTAREKRVSLFDGLLIPDSHLIVTGEGDLFDNDIALFSRIKIKGSADLKRTKQLARQCLSLASSDCRLRIDFNGVLTTSQVRDLAQVLGSAICERIEFIEDPTHFNAATWLRLQDETKLNFALDRDADKLQTKDSGIDWLVIKPAVTEVIALLDRFDGTGYFPNLLVTSYMDHAIGQMYAAYQAALLKKQYGKKVRECGLLTHILFEKEDFFEFLNHQGPALMAPGGTGLGFDQQLQGLAWKKI